MKDTKIKSKYDNVLLASVIGLICIGMVMIYSASSIFSKEHFGSQYFFIAKHLMWMFIGAGAMCLGLKLKHSAIKKLAYPALGLSLLLLTFLVVSGQGVLKSGAATRWISMGGFSFQPAEIAKISLVIFLAAYISRIGQNITSFKKGYLPIVAVSGAVIVLILAQPDFGTAVMLSLIVFLMLFVAGTRLSYLAGTLILALPPAVYMIMRSSYRLKRIVAFTDPWKDPLGSGFQVIQSFIAFSNGGFLGQGLGDGKQKLLYLPEAHTDFIFSVIGEELGLIGVLVVLLLFIIFIYRGFALAFKARDGFCVMLAVGITSMIGLQAFVNMGVTMGLLPTKGLTLPFISYGGTSLIVTMFAAGLLLNLSSSLNQCSSFEFRGRI